MTGSHVVAAVFVSQVAHAPTQHNLENERVKGKVK